MSLCVYSYGFDKADKQILLPTLQEWPITITYQLCVCTLCTRVSRDVVEGHHQYLTMRTKKNRRIIGIGHHYICEVERKKEHTKSHIRKNRDTSQFIRTVVGIVRSFIL